MEGAALGCCSRVLLADDEASGSDGEGGKKYGWTWTRTCSQNLEGVLLGTEATRILREKDEGVLIVGCTGNSTIADSMPSEESGQDAFWSNAGVAEQGRLEELGSAQMNPNRSDRGGGREREGEGGGGGGKGAGNGYLMFTGGNLDGGNTFNRNVVS